MGLFSKKTAKAVTLNALVTGWDGQCPHCKRQLQWIVDMEARDHLRACRGIGVLEEYYTMDNARAMDKARANAIEAGLKCRCGVEIKSFAK